MILNLLYAIDRQILQNIPKTQLDIVYNTSNMEASIFPLGNPPQRKWMGPTSQWEDPSFLATFKKVVASILFVVCVSQVEIVSIMAEIGEDIVLIVSLELLSVFIVIHRIL